MLSAQIDLYGGSGVLAVLDERNAGRQVVDVDACGYVTIPARTGVVELGQALVLRLSTVQEITDRRVASTSAPGEARHARIDLRVVT